MIVICPLCGKSWPVPKVQQAAPALAAVFGMSSETLSMVHRDQEANRLQRELDAHFAAHTGTEWANALVEARSNEPCRRCDGGGLIANTDDGEPWTFWAGLPPGSDLAVQMGIVAPIPCPACFPDQAMGADVASRTELDAAAYERATHGEPYDPTSPVGLLDDAYDPTDYPIVRGRQ